MGQLQLKNVHSIAIEFAKLLLSICSEIDVICKLICHEIDPHKKVKNIDQFRSIIKNKFPKFHSTTIHVPIMDISLKPWDSWSFNENPKWWKAYNGVKHKRNMYYHNANLKNTLDALSGLLAVVFYYYKMISVNPMGDIPILLDMEGLPGRVYIGGMPKLPDF